MPKEISKVETRLQEVVIHVAPDGIENICQNDFDKTAFDNRYMDRVWRRAGVVLRIEDKRFGSCSPSIEQLVGVFKVLVEDNVISIEDLKENK